MDEYLEDLDGDIEYTDEDFISEEDMEGALGDSEESIAMPFTSIHMSVLPDKLNPVKVFKQKELILYNPNNRIQSYNKVTPALLTFDMLKNNLIVSSIKFEQNSSLAQFAIYSKILNKGVTSIVGKCIDYEKSLSPESNSSNEQNTFKKPFKPKPQGVAHSRNKRKSK